MTAHSSRLASALVPDPLGAVGLDRAAVASPPPVERQPLERHGLFAVVDAGGETRLVREFCRGLTVVAPDIGLSPEQHEIYVDEAMADPAPETRI